MSQFDGPDKVKAQLNDVKEKLQKAIPDSLKELEWEKGVDLMVEQLLSLVHKALKWSFIVLFVLSSLSDVIFSISRNLELVMPFGLLVGCLLADLLKETSQELFPNSQVCFLILCSFLQIFRLWKCLLLYFCHSMSNANWVLDRGKG